MIVVDATVVALAFLNPDRDPRVSVARHRLRADGTWAAPDHWHAELMNTIRGMWRGAQLSDGDARRAVDALAATAVKLIPVSDLTERVWELRGSLTAYDAAYVAAAEVQDATLVTADARIADAQVARCPIDVIR